MDPIRDFFDLGTDIMETVTKAVEKNDFTGLADALKRQVGGFKDNYRYDEDLRKAKANYESGNQPYVNARPGAGDQQYQWTAAGSRPQGYTGTGTRPQGYAGQNARQQYYANQQARQQAYTAQKARQQNTYRPNVYVNNGERPSGPYMKKGQFGAGTQTANWQRPESEKVNLPQTVNRGLTPFVQQRPSKVSAVLKEVGGITGLAITGPGTIALAILIATVGGPGIIAGTAITAAGLAASAFLTHSGVKDVRLVDQFNRYSKLIGNAEYIALDDLAAMAGETREQVEQNLDRMIAKKMLPQAKFDEKKSTLILTQQAYSQYRLAEDARAQREAAAAARRDSIDGMDVPEDIKDTLRRGSEFIATVREQNERIPDAEMTEKLYQLEHIVDRIFAQVKKEPASARDLNKFLSYYLPTTEKLINAYIDLDKQPVAGENIATTKREINEALDTINVAFENLLDDLYQEVAWDISSDISVMKTMMAQDGLTDEVKKEHGNKKTEVN